MSPKPKGQIGIFWMTPDDVYSSTEDVDTAESCNGFRDSSKNHVDVWPTLQKQNPKLRYQEYFEIPRGRVVFDETKSRFQVYADKRLLNPKDQSRIINTFSLPPYSTDFTSDPHYTTDPEDLDRLFD